MDGKEFVKLISLQATVSDCVLAMNEFDSLNQDNILDCLKKQRYLPALYLYKKSFRVQELIIIHVKQTFLRELEHPLNLENINFHFYWTVKGPQDALIGGALPNTNVKDFPMDKALLDFANLPIKLDQGGGIYRFDMVQNFDNFRILYSGAKGNCNFRNTLNDFYSKKKWFKLMECINVMLLDGCFRWIYKNGNFAKECIGDRRNGQNIEREVVDENGQLIFRLFYKDRQQDSSTFTRKQ